MLTIGDSVHIARRGLWRLVGVAQVHRVKVAGPTQKAVLTAVRKALREKPSSVEAGWVERIEQARATMLASREPLEIEDFGSGRAVSGSQTKMLTRTLGKKTTDSKPPRWGYLLFRLVRELQPAAGVELGACVGISAAYQAAAMELNGKGRMISLEGATVLAERSQQTIDELHLSDRGTVLLGQFSDTLPGTLADTTPLQWAFVDGHHDETATLEYMEQILGAAAPDAVLVFDDINWSPGMARAWRTIVADPRFALIVGLHSVGLAVVSSANVPRQVINIAYA